MTVKNVFTKFLEDLVQAQYNSYVYSQSLGEQGNSLLSIPFAEIKEITLDLNYAYDGNSAPTTCFQYNIDSLKNETLALLQMRLQSIMKLITEVIEENGIVNNDEWTTIKKGLKSEELKDFLTDFYKNGFQKNLTPLIMTCNDMQTELNPNNWSTMINLLELDALQQEILSHKDLQNWLTPRISQKITNQVKDNQTNDETNWLISLNLAKEIVQQSLNVVVDADQLKKYPAESIQKAKVVMRMKNLTIEK